MFMNRLWAVNINNTQKGNLHNKDRIMGDFFLYFAKYYLNIFTAIIVLIFLFCYERTQRANENMNR